MIGTPGQLRGFGDWWTIPTALLSAVAGTAGSVTASATGIHAAPESAQASMVGEYEGSGGYIYAFRADRSIKIIRSPRSAAGTVVQPGSAYYNAILTEITRLFKAGKRRSLGTYGPPPSVPVAAPSIPYVPGSVPDPYAQAATTSGAMQPQVNGAGPVAEGPTTLQVVGVGGLVAASILALAWAFGGKK